MDSLQWFILAILGIIAVVAIHKREVRARLIMQLRDDGASADHIAKIMRAFGGEEEE